MPVKYIYLFNIYICIYIMYDLYIFFFSDLCKHNEDHNDSCFPFLPPIHCDDYPSCMYFLSLCLCVILKLLKNKYNNY